MRTYRPFQKIAAVVVALVAVLAFSAASACATEPWWHVNTVSAPASQPGGESRLVLEVSNLGDAAVEGSSNPVTIVDRLPAGVTVLTNARHEPEIYPEGGGSFPIGINGVKEVIHCSLAGQVVTCTYAGPLLPYERFMIAITVRAEPGAGTGVSEVSVSGGGAPPFALSRALALSEAPAPFGVEDYEITPEEEGGASDTQAGSHPFQLTTTLTFNTKAAPVYQSHEGAGSGIFDEPAGVFPEVQPVALAKDLRFTLPPGLLGNPTPLPQCPLKVFLHPSNTVQCPDDTAIGVATPIITNVALLPYVPLAPTSPLFNVEPSQGEPAKFGFETPLGPVILDTSVRTGEGYAVLVSAPNIPSYLPFIGSQVTLWGVPGDARHDTSRGQCLAPEAAGGFQEYMKLEREGKDLETSCPVQEKPRPFLIMPASCEGPLHTSVEGDSWEAIGKFTAREYTFANEAGEPFGLDGCNQLSFEPQIKVAPDGQSAATPTGLAVDVHVDQEASLDPTATPRQRSRTRP